MTAAQRQALLQGTGEYEQVEFSFGTKEYFDKSYRYVKLQETLENNPATHPLYYEVMLSDDEPVTPERVDYYKKRYQSLSDEQYKE